MIVAGVFCAHPPLLLPGMSGRQDVGAELRTASHEALRSVTRLRPESIVIVGGTTLAERERRAVPLSIRVGHHLLTEVDYMGPVDQVIVPSDAESVADRMGVAIRERAGRTALLVMGDGSARRDERAPGYLDNRAAAFDRTVEKALCTGDPQALRELDADLAGELMVAGLAAWRVLATAVAGNGVPDADLLYADDPFGVMYFVATWIWRHAQM